jgi:YggT family protein
MLRPVLFWSAALLAVFALLDWLVRKRHISAFSPVARFIRDHIDPLFKPVERRIVRAGGNPTSAPLWTLAGAVIGGIVVLTVLGFVRSQVQLGFYGLRSGPQMFGVVLLQWTFGVIRMALLVTVISSWFRVSPYSRWVRWAFAITEPLLRPLRQVIPPLGMVDITPLVAYFLLGFIERFVIGAVM